jgi:Cysteine-rich CPCC/Bacteriocin-protection, YdeI or OmpD-Associated/Domain of unknown function (DUF1905)
MEVINKKYTCPCCGYKTHNREDSLWDICQVCFWQNDPPTLSDPYYEGGANGISLIKAQQNFIAFGACDKRSISSVRPPMPNESKDENWKIIGEGSKMNKILKFNNGMHYVMVEQEIVTSFLSKNSKRAICNIGSLSFHCAFMPKKEGGYFINLGANICKQLNLIEGNEVTLSFTEDNSEFQFEMPKEFSEVLYQDPDADAVFQGLTDGNKRGLIYVITLVKSSEKRIERALKVAEKLKMGVTSPRLIFK